MCGDRSAGTLTRVELPDDELYLADHLGAALSDEAAQDLLHTLQQRNYPLLRSL